MVDGEPAAQLLGLRSERALRRADRRVRAVAKALEPIATGPSWWMFLAIGVVFLVTGATLLGAIGKQLQAMHLPGAEGSGIDLLLSPSAVKDAVATWAAFWRDPEVGILAEDQFVVPVTLADVWLLVDTLLFIPGYALGTVVVFLHEHERKETSSVDLRPLLRWGAVTVIGLAIVDLLENVMTLALVHAYWSGGRGDVGATDRVLVVVSALKWLLAAFVVVGAVVLAGIRYRNRKDETRRAVRLLRAQIGVTVIAVVALYLPFQLPDVILRIDRGQVLWVLGFALLFGTATWAMGRHLIVAHERRLLVQGRGRRTRRLVPLLLVAGLVAVALANLLGDQDPVSALAPLVPLVVLLFLGSLGLPLRSVGTKAEISGEERSLGPAGRVLPRILAAASITAAGLAAIRAAVGSYTQTQPVPLILAMGIALIVGALLATVALDAIDRRRQRHGRPLRDHRYGRIAVLVAAVTAASIGWQVASPIAGPQQIGGLGVVLLFFAALSLLGGGLVLLADWWVDRRGLPPAFTAFRLPAIPVFTLLLVWSLAAAALDDGRHWDVRVRSGAEKPISLETAFSTWVQKAAERERTEPEAVVSPSGKRTIPMVLVATSGGGIRAAYWTALALDCIFRGQQAENGSAGNPCDRQSGRRIEPHDLFLASGISGGSLGLVEWDAHLQHSSHTNRDWVEKRLGEDFVSPSLARGLLVELVRSFLHFKTSGRAEIIEQAWERAWTSASDGPMEEGFLASQRRSLDEGRGLLLLNGASVFDGCALNVSLLHLGSTVNQVAVGTSGGRPVGDCMAVERYDDRIGATGRPDLPGPLPGTADLVDYLVCGEGGRNDVRRSTAALLSARYPYVSSAGRLTACGRERTAKSSSTVATSTRRPPRRWCPYGARSSR